MGLKFTKMHGLGNDFVVVDAWHQTFDPDADACRRIADRRFGVGCDQILLVEPPRLDGAKFHYRIFNADGSEVEQCGNGARCFARFVREKGLSDADEIPVGTASGLIRLLHRPGGLVQVDMGHPRFEHRDIPFHAPESSVDSGQYSLEVEGRQVQVSALSMGNPHAVLQVEDVGSAPVAELGPVLERHRAFPRRVNVGFMERVDPGRIRLRVHERGSGETLACGTGACAAVVAGRMLELLDPQVTVELPGGELNIEWQGEGQPVWMIGPATSVFEGEWITE